MKQNRSHHLLIIDDDADSRILLRKIAENDGYTVTESDGVTAGLSAQAQASPHAILLDVMMPGGSGFDFLEKRRQDPLLAKVPVIVISAVQDKAAIHKAFSLGANEYLTKPIKARILLQKLLKTLRDRDFAKVTFEAQKPKIRVHLSGTIVSANEAGFLLEAPAKIAPRMPLSVRSVVLEELGCSGSVMQKTARPAYAGHPGFYLNEIAVVGLDAEAVQKIRLAMRKWG